MKNKVIEGCTPAPGYLVDDSICTQVNDTIFDIRLDRVESKMTYQIVSLTLLMRSDFLFTTLTCHRTVLEVFGQGYEWFRQVLQRFCDGDVGVLRALTVC